MTVALDLHGRRALVTGSTAGIGLAVARALASAGAAVVVNGRTGERVDRAVDDVRGSVPGADVSGAVGDVGTAEGVARVVEAAPDVDVLVNNAGVFEQSPFAQTGDEVWERALAVNVLSGVRLSRHHVPRMVARGWGRVVFVSSESALHVPVEMVHYGVTKTAQLALARGIAESVPESGVTVNSVLPGPTRSEGVGAMMDGMAERQGRSRAEVEEAFLAEERPTSLLGRLIEPDEVASLVLYLCSPLASATTGSALRVDGGVVRAVV